MAPVQTAELLDGRYRVLDTIGTGGTATVLLAEDQHLGRRVAIKRLHADGPAEMARRFGREARLGASLNHPNLVAVFDTLAQPEGVLIVMEHVPGQTLREALLRGAPPTRQAIAILEAIAAALDHAHAHGVVHRDVKPANVILRDDGVVKLADLGLATAIEDTGITASGEVLGTPAYMAPEQLEGGRAGPATDVHALALVAFETLSGRRARTGTTPLEIATRIVEEPAPDLREAWPDAPPAAAEVIRRGLARHPGERPMTAGRLIGDLERALERGDGAPAATTATAPLASAAPKRPARRPPAVAPQLRRTLVPALLVLVAGIAIVAALRGGGEGGGAERAAADRPTAGRREASERPARRERAASAPSAPAAPAPAGGAGADGGSLNAQGYALMRQGRFGEAVPVLRRAVAAFPAGSGELEYAYALFNLGSALLRSGDPDAAIPVLERRLRIPNQRDTVARELKAARKAAKKGRGPG